VTIAAGYALVSDVADAILTSLKNPAGLRKIENNQGLRKTSGKHQRRY
jgi:hypothetical protein